MSWTTECDLSLSKGMTERDKVLKQGDSWSITVVFDKYYADMEVAGAIRTDYQGSGTDVLTFQSVTTDNLTWGLNALPVDTLTLVPGNEYVYDIEYRIPSMNIVKTFIGGKVTVTGQVTPSV
jgi:hypothetical protein